MAVTDKLNDEWGRGEQSRAVFEFRAAAQNFYTVLEQTVAKMDKIAAGSKFGGVDIELKAEGVEIKNEIEMLKTTLDDNLAFIKWTQP